ncbi:MAG: response regulator [Methanotrichaceae archaeon]
MDTAKCRKFTIKVGDFELTMEDAIKQQQQLISGLQDKLLQGKTKPEKLKTLLWVDDNPINNAILMHELNKKGINITIAQSTEEALSKVNSKSKQEKFDAIITDMGRTDESGRWLATAGIDLARKIREMNDQTPIFIYRWSEVAKNKRKEALDAGVTEIAGSTSDLIDNLWKL